MAIVITKLKSEISRRTRASGEVFDEAVYSAINDVIYDLIRDTVLEVEGIDESTPPTEIDLDEKYYPVFREGVLFYLGKAGVYSRRPENVNRDDYDNMLGAAAGTAHEDADTPCGVVNTNGE